LGSFWGLFFFFSKFKFSIFSCCSKSGDQEDLAKNLATRQIKK
jgi:hypothetical protein